MFLFQFTSCSCPAPELDLGKESECLICQQFGMRRCSLLQPHFEVKPVILCENFSPSVVFTLYAIICHLG